MTDRQGSGRARWERTRTAQVRNGVIAILCLAGVSVWYGTSGGARLDAWRRTVESHVPGGPVDVQNAPSKACVSEYTRIVLAERAMKRTVGGYGNADQLMSGRFLTTPPTDYLVMLDGPYPDHIHDSYRIFPLGDCG